MRTPWPRLVLLGLVLLTGGCGTLSPSLQAPELRFVSAELARASVLEQRLKVRMAVTNPNDRDIAVRGVTYTLEVAGEELGRGVADSAFVVPSRGETAFDVWVTANLAPVLLRLAAQWGREAKIPYRIRGEVALSSGLLRRIPFDERGELPLR